MLKRILTKKKPTSQLSVDNEDTKAIAKTKKNSKVKKGSCGLFTLLCCGTCCGLGYNCGSKLCPCCGFNEDGECGDCCSCSDCNLCDCFDECLYECMSKYCCCC